MTAPWVGITLPTVAPIPMCTSGMAATCPWMIGRLATFSSCLRACGSRSGVHTFTGTRPPVMTCAMGMSVERVEIPEEAARGLLRPRLVHARLRRVGLEEEIVGRSERERAELGRLQLAQRRALPDDAARLVAAAVLQRRAGDDERDHQAYRRPHVARPDRVQVPIA